MSRLRILLAVAALALLAGASSAHAFGTVHQLGQDGEHERITRSAIWCEATEHPRDCFEDWSTDQLAGTYGSFGAVGAPDSDDFFDSDAHCDDADFMTRGGHYPHTRAQATAALMACRAYGARHLQKAVRAAKDMLDGSGRLIKGEVEPSDPCTFVGGASGAAKCDALEGFGRALHMAHDFYSHSNWADDADPGKLPGDLNPPGLGHTDLVPLFDWNISDPALPEDLTTGCFNFTHPELCGGRVDHEVLNKDKGLIDPHTGAGSKPKTLRGKIGTNFAKAVTISKLETRRQWAMFADRLVTTYGVRKGHLMVCALTHDHPYTDCRLKLTLEGKQTVSWTVDSTLEGHCGGHFRGNGATTTTFKSKEPVYASPIDLLAPEDDDGEPAGIPILTRAVLDSSGKISVSDAPICSDGGGVPTKPDCGTKAIDLPLEVLSRREDEVTLRNDGDLPADPYKNCPNGIFERTRIEPGDGELSDDDLFDEDVARIDVLGQRRRTIIRAYTGVGRHGQDTATIRLTYTLTIEKVDQRDRPLD